MHKIDMPTWQRQELFELFNTFNHPYFNLCNNINRVSLKAAALEAKVSDHDMLIRAKCLFHLTGTLHHPIGLLRVMWHGHTDSRML